MTTKEIILSCGLVLTGVVGYITIDEQVDKADTYKKLCEAAEAREQIYMSKANKYEWLYGEMTTNYSNCQLSIPGIEEQREYYMQKYYEEMNKTKDLQSRVDLLNVEIMTRQFHSTTNK